jgi:pyruvate dehydrogenase E2 component (dihydrolipoamide acetyltransferase)
MAEKILMIALSPTMNEGTIASWNKKEGEKVSAGDVLCVVETDKAAMDYESQSEGVLLKILVPDGGQAKVADPIAILGSAGEDISSLLSAAPGDGGLPPPSSPGVVASASRQHQAEVAPETPSAGRRVRSSPLARKLADARGIDIALMAGSGPGGRVVKRDVDAASAPGATQTVRAQGQASVSRADQTIPVTAKRKVIAQRLSESAFSAPHFYLTVSIEMNGLLAARARLNSASDVKVSFNAFLHKLAAEALRRHPEVNSSWQGESIKRFGSVDIGLAVALPDGLITPVVRGCDHKGVLAIDTELGELVRKAREGKLQPDEYTGATFTISNLGSFGIEEFTAIINPPASAILALGKVQKVPVVGDGDELIVRSMMKATLSCDHRVIDGATGAVFLRDLKEMIENPYAVLL